MKCYVILIFIWFRCKLITHQYLLLDITGALKNVSNILSLVWHFWLSKQYSSACTTFANTILPPYVHSYSSLSFYMEQSPGCSMHAHQPVCEPCMHTALVCMLAVHDTVCTLLQRTAGQGYWTYIVAKKVGSFVCLVTTKIRLALPRSDAAQCTEILIL